ncbi:hypothetical protein [Algoriphagus halophytocola]|uniref:Outer membrane protein beta-barrel domain-containing protein n=1 Tax=Algoriphagus halophytocola TaxID=2991499 RepID=A0ABY6MLD0_9BACT|nr:hypothetical protein [Algoriphagus sp. TR-M5]UZD23081.1 hypothetical protein OM944_01020 [Algoriphagus sp. TR-M5]
MKEDKLDQLIAASLKKKLEEAEVPYELGAWESFQKKRKLKQRKAIVYWVSGIAAGLALLLAVGNVLDSDDLNQTGASQEIIADQGHTEQNPPVPADGSIEPEQEAKVKSPESFKPSEPENTADSELLAAQKSENQASKKTESKPVPEVPAAVLTERQLASNPTEPQLPVKPENPLKQEVIGEGNLTAAINSAEPEKQVEKPAQSLALAPAKSEEKNIAKIDLAEPKEEKADFPEIEKDKTMVNLGMGVSPGFGGAQANNSVTSASTIGLGMLVDIDLPGKLVVGSGLGLNYLNQVNEVQSSIQAYGNSYPQTDKTEVRQMQIEMPVFVQYPITRNNSISLQAGFSNFFALNQKADLEYTANAPVPSFNADALGSSSFSIQNKVVQESRALESKDGRFYPFATVNLGVNLRVLETKGASYVIMPFYNYQVKQISGYGDTYGLFGASFKLNFGGGEK